MFKATKALSINCGQMIAAWLFAGYQRFPDRSATEQHKDMFQAQNRESKLCSCPSFTVCKSIARYTTHGCKMFLYLNIPAGHGLLMDDIHTW